MAHVKIGPLYSWFQASQEERRVIFQATRATLKNQYFVKQWRMAPWAGEIKMFDTATGRLPSGLLEDARRALYSEGHPLTEEYLDDYTIPEGSAELRVDIDPEHQLDAVHAMATNKRGVVWAATNSGKTRIAEAWCCLHKAKTLYLVPSRELLNQTVKSFQRDTNLKVGWISAVEGWDVGADVTVALASTVSHAASRKKFTEIAKQFQAVIVDECHHVKSNSYKWIMRALKHVHYRYGLSGTPWNPKYFAEELQVKAYLGPVIAKITNSELVERGWSAKPKIHFIEVDQRLRLDPETEYGQAYEEFIVRSVLRNSMIMKLADESATRGKSCLIVSRRLEHCDRIADLLDSKGLSYGILTGETGKEERKEILNAFSAKEIPILISTILGEGVDIPTLNTIILASGEKEFKQHLQRIGRGLRRKADEDNTVDVYDFIDRGWDTLNQHSLERMRIFKREGFEVVRREVNF